MFKKSLLALSVASVTAFTANAGILSASITETAAVKTTVDAIPAAASSCAAIAEALGVSVTNTGVNTFEDTAVVDAVAAVAVDSGTVGVYDTGANTVVWTADDICQATVASDVLVSASNVSNSLEGAQANGVTVTARLIAGVGGYTDEDTVRIQVTGGVIDEDASASATLTGSSSAFTLLGVVGNEVLFTVDTGTQTSREIVALAGLVVTPNDSVTELSLDAQTQNTANVVYDTSNNEKVTVLESQFSAKVNAKFDGIIDVGTERLTLAVNADDALESVVGAPSVIVSEIINEDTFVVTVTEETSQGNLVADTATLEIKGDFSWMAQLDTSDDDEAITSAELQTGFAYTTYVDGTFAVAGNDAVSKAAINEAMDKLTVTITTTGGLDVAHAFNFDVPGVTGKESLNEQMFTGHFYITDDSAGTDGYDADLLADGSAMGEWKLNGSVVTVPYMPFGPNTKVIMRHTNTGVQEGDVTVRYMLEGVSDNWESVGVVASSSRGVMDIRDAVVDAIMADAGIEKGKVAIEITTNVPEADVTVYAAYTVKDSADDRGFVGTFGEHGSAK